MESARVATVEEFTHAVIQITRTTTIRNGKEWTHYDQIKQLLTTRDAAIRAESADRAVKWVKDHADTDWVRNEFDPQSLHAAIMGEEG